MTKMFKLTKFNFKILIVFLISRNSEIARKSIWMISHALAFSHFGFNPIIAAAFNVIEFQIKVLTKLFLRLNLIQKKILIEIKCLFKCFSHSSGSNHYFKHRRKEIPKCEIISIQFIKNQNNEENCVLSNSFDNPHLSLFNRNVQSESNQINLKIKSIPLSKIPFFTHSNDNETNEDINLNHFESLQLNATNSENFLRIKEPFSIRKAIQNQMKLSLTYSNSMSSPNLKIFYN